MTEPTDVEFRPLTIPASMDASDADEFREFTRVRNEVYREIAGTDDDALTPEELLPHYQPSPEEIRYVWVAVVDGEIVGRVSVDLPLEEGSRAAFWLIEPATPVTCVLKAVAACEPRYFSSIAAGSGDPRSRQWLGRSSPWSAGSAPRYPAYSMSLDFEPLPPRS